MDGLDPKEWAGLKSQERGDSRLGSSINKTPGKPQPGTLRSAHLKLKCPSGETRGHGSERGSEMQVHLDLPE